MPTINHVTEPKIVPAAETKGIAREFEYFANNNIFFMTIDDLIDRKFVKRAKKKK